MVTRRWENLCHNNFSDANSSQFVESEFKVPESIVDCSTIICRERQKELRSPLPIDLPTGSISALMHSIAIGDASMPANRPVSLFLSLSLTYSFVVWVICSLFHWKISVLLFWLCPSSRFYTILLIKNNNGKSIRDDRIRPFLQSWLSSNRVETRCQREKIKESWILENYR